MRWPPIRSLYFAISFTESLIVDSPAGICMRVYFEPMKLAIYSVRFVGHLVVSCHNCLNTFGFTFRLEYKICSFFGLEVF